MVKILHIDDRGDDRQLVEMALEKVVGLELSQFENLASFDKSFRDINADLYIFDGEFPFNSSNPTIKNWHNATELVAAFNPNSKVLIYSGNPPAEEEWRKYDCIKGVYAKGASFDAKSFRETILSHLG